MKNETFKKKTMNTKNMEFSYILRTAVGNKNMKNLADYDVQVVASDAELAGKIDEDFAKVGANEAKISYLEPIAPLDGKSYRLPVRKMAAVASAKEEAPVEEVAPEVVEEAPVEEAAPEVVEEAAPEEVEETPVEE